MTPPSGASPGMSRATLAIQYAFMTVVGCAVAIHLLIDLNPGESLMGWIQAGVIFGGFIGLAQWWVLFRYTRRVLAGQDIARTRMGRRIVRETAWWGLATLAGFAAGPMAAEMTNRYLFRTLPEPVLHGLIGLVLGAVGGLGQVIVLRRRLPHSWAWVAWTLIGLVAGGILLGSIKNWSFENHLNNLARGIALGLPFGVAQAACLYRLEPIWTKCLLDEALERRARSMDD